ncbi:uncharacterized protein [Ptychodera flava]|uniref:uncharacterized protein n=1 Tax=Ptychodera flava TaxID=63121 RepID=UPI00396A8543
MALQSAVVFAGVLIFAMAGYGKTELAADETGPEFRHLPRYNFAALLRRRTNSVDLSKKTYQEQNDKSAYYDPDGCGKWFDDEIYRCYFGKQCVPEYTICDGNFQCDDGSDEVNCEKPDTSSVTKPYYDQSGCAKWFPDRYPYRCGDGSYCVTTASICDGKITCPDGSDESQCDTDDGGNPTVGPATPLPVTAAPKAYYDSEGCAAYFPDRPYRCVDGSMCLQEANLCDGLAYCTDFSDEHGCPEFGKTDEHGCTVPNQVGNNGEDDYHIQVLDAHNYFRCLHGLGPYIWNKQLADFALGVARDNSASGSLEHSGGPYGENLGYAGVPTFNHGTGYGLVKLWYEEIELYDYSQPGFQKGTGHFTQMIWAGNTEIGCASVLDGYRVYLACEYAPGGNIATTEYFRENVLPPL